MPKIIRLTLFKIPEDAAVEETIKIYSTLTRDALKDDKQYISVAKAERTYKDDRNQGFTLVARTVFNSVEDMNYYDKDCEAHKKIKALVGPKVAGPPLVVYMDAE
ncbi:hypothetical protein K491DRAFT_390065 [Lophiostoma macrostomum CBS 122681]|uniref:Stress-response A/B barrel domain-containing protein n=1 Tax=Lophiostoma macrostomum CBS 122681 TaxID=1314788 RepID=A0A6A6TBS4_9PLEO|nr:hypothetical protein K491DRAFT_390065 [Lophiostoma macrostomum CBS 122681]